MPDFSEVQSDLAKQRKSRDVARRNGQLGKYALRQIEMELVQAKRAGDTNAVPELEAKAAGLRDSVSADFKEHDRLRAAELAALGRSAEFWDPQKHIDKLDAKHPILLFPLRLETRFKSAPDDPRRKQLWLRIYPDEIAVDSFEELLSPAEIATARHYWRDLWAGAGNEAAHKAAWRSFASHHGPGRARWILERYRPENEAEIPTESPGTHWLVISHTNSLDPTVQNTIADYWLAIWQADGDAALQQDANQLLVDNFGPERAAEVVREFVPAGLSIRPADAFNAKVRFLHLPSDADVAAQVDSWGSMSSARILPERFVVLGRGENEVELKTLGIGKPVPGDLQIGPDPAAPEDEQIRIENDELILPEGLKWIADFDAAEAHGMAIRIDLNDRQAKNGFAEVMVLGVRLSDDLKASADNLENLITRHVASRKGMEILRQGTPTNNTETDPSGYSWIGDPDLSFDQVFKTTGLTDPENGETRRDGRYLADSLGISPDVARLLPNYFGEDQRDAVAMNAALWPATIGYFLEKMCAPLIDEKTTREARDFFTNHVKGRGFIPALRVGKQPYGILPSAPIHRLTWGDSSDKDSFERSLYPLLKKVDKDWLAMSAKSARVGEGSDPQRALLDALSLHPSSVNFFSEIAQSPEQIINTYRFFGDLAPLIADYLTENYTNDGMKLLEQLDIEASGENPPDILTKFFVKGATSLKGPVVEIGPLSEEDGLLVIRDDGLNYIEWLAEAARESHDTLRRQEGFDQSRPPTALLYLMLRHALDASFVDTAIDAHAVAGLLSEAQKKTAKMDPRFLAISRQEKIANPWSFVYAKNRQITGQASVSIGEWIPRALPQLDSYLSVQLSSLDHLAALSKSRLERAFVEHLDCCSYRLDAWWSGLLSARTDDMRDLQSQAGASGSYLGAFGYVEDLKPNKTELRPARVDSDVADALDDRNQAKLLQDPSNAGYILAPSLDHAVTSAILRNGNLAHSGSEDGDILAVKLTSDRVRLALATIEGIRNGQSLGALLGYRFERALHDRSGLMLNEFILEFRQAFPLVANKTDPDTAVPDEPVEVVDARNVVDGKALIDAVRESDETTYPYGLSILPTINDDARRSAIEEEIEAIADIADAVSDLMVAESVHQVAQGNYDRASATLDAVSKGGFPPQPEIVKTPRSGVTLTHRLALHLPSGLDPADPQFTTPRARTEPALASWLASILPPTSEIAAQLRYTSSAGNLTSHLVTAEQLGLHHADLLYVGALDDSQSARFLDDHLVHFAWDKLSPDGASKIEIDHTAPISGKTSFFELGSAMSALRACVLNSRSLRPTDMSLQGEAALADEAALAFDIDRLTRTRQAAEAVQAEWQALQADCEASLSGPDVETIELQVLNAIDSLIDRFATASTRLAFLSIPNPGAAKVLEWRRAQFAKLRDSVIERVARWDKKLADFDARLSAYANFLPTVPDTDRMKHLIATERVLSRTRSTPDPADHVAFRDTLENTLRPAFVAGRDELRNRASITAGLGNLHSRIAEIEAFVATHDAVPFDRHSNVAEAKRFVGEMTELTAQVLADLDGGLAKHQSATAAALAAGPKKQAELALEAIRAILGEEFVALPEFTLPGPAHAELASSWADRDAILDYVRASPIEREFPIDDWLTGLARVRDKSAALEKASALCDIFGSGEIALSPLQMPYQPDDIWLGLEFPAEHPVTAVPLLEGEKLLYTAHFATSFDPAKAQVGLLLDEWTELVPSRDETAGLAFQFDRPNAEAPQSLILAMPADLNAEGWAWDDLVDSVRSAVHLAKLRTVEPEHVQETDYGRFLPALISTITAYPMMPMLNLSYNNAVQFRETVE